jgi:ceramide synthetase
MFIHHIVTLMLLTFSWTVNFVRIGTLVLVIHDFADIPLEGAKICRYLHISDGISNSVFGVFTLSWIFSRLGLLPYRVIAYSCFWGLSLPERPVKFFPVYYIFNALLIALQVLHVIWTVLILRVAYNAIYVDGVKDLREDSSLSSSQSADEVDDAGDESRDHNQQQDSKKTSSNGLLLSAGDGASVVAHRKPVSNGTTVVT